MKAEKEKLVKTTENTTRALAKADTASTKCASLGVDLAAALRRISALEGGGGAAQRRGGGGS